MCHLSIKVKNDNFSLEKQIPNVLVCYGCHNTKDYRVNGLNSFSQISDPYKSNINVLSGQVSSEPFVRLIDGHLLASRFYLVIGTQVRLD